MKNLSSIEVNIILQSEDCIFENVQIKNFDFSQYKMLEKKELRLCSTILYNSGMRNLTINNSEFVGTQFYKCDFTNTDFYNCVFKDCEFINCTNLLNQFTSCEFMSCKFIHNDFVSCTILNTKILNGIFQNLSLCNTNTNHVIIENASLFNVEFRISQYADFSTTYIKKENIYITFGVFIFLIKKRGNSTNNEY